MNSITRKNSGLPFSQVNITNLVDVALTLVIILIIISPFLDQGIEVKLPAASESRIDTFESVVVTAAKGDVYYLGEREVTLREMYNILRERTSSGEEISLVVKGDEDVPYQNIVKVLDIAKRCRINTIGLATRAE